MLEKCIHLQLVDYLESHNLLNNAQFGFRSRRNTSQAIFNFLDNIYQNINQNIDTLAIYVDFRKAFDTVHHLTLLNKLKQFHLWLPAISFFDSYLKDRTQQVFVNKQLSPCKTVTTGVPQGSTLGPLLFILYINDLPRIFHKAKSLLFADDTVIFHPVSDNLHTTFKLVQAELDILHLWCRNNLLEVNAGKTKVMYFSSKFLNSTSKPYRKLNFGGMDLVFVDEYRYLGLTIDTRLSFAHHINNTLKTLSFRVMQLKKIRNSITHKIALQLYKCMILPIMDYADIFCHNKSSKLLKKFQIMQNRCVRLISRFPRLTSTEEETKKLELIATGN